MAVQDDLNKEIDVIFNISFDERDGQVVPEPGDVKLSDGAVKLDATILYADISGSTKLVDGYKWWFAAKIYKAFLHAACKIIKDNSGEIVAFDGDRVMAIFIGGSKNTSAAKTALKINHARKLINEKISAKWSTDFELKHSVGIDKSEVRAVRTGIRGSNDLVWVGRAANHAAKLGGEAHGNYFSWITKAVYDSMADEVKYDKQGNNMWKKYSWTDFNEDVYASTYWWSC